MCSYVNDWSINYKTFNYTKTLLEKFIVHFIYLVIYFKNNQQLPRKLNLRRNQSLKILRIIFKKVKKS